MRLLRLDPHKCTWIVEEFTHPRIPFYAVLSHTWGRNNEEVKLADIESGERQYSDTSKLGYDKLRFCQKQLERDGLRYFWIDTCCIKKSDNLELQLSLASMFYWYQKATTCYVWLSDVSIDDAASWERAFSRSRWFERGWTLQELIAPNSVRFFSKEGNFIGDKEGLASTISIVCRVPRLALQGAELSRFSTDERLSWTKGRVTTLPEDAAYCLLGIFDVELPTLYADGDYTKRKNMALSKLLKAINEKGVGTERLDDFIHIGGAFWKDLITLKEEQLLALDTDLDEYCKWLLDGSHKQHIEQHGISTEIMTGLSQHAGKRMKRLLTKNGVGYEDLSRLETEVKSWDEPWGRYMDEHETSQVRVQGLMQNRWYWTKVHEDIFKGITAARTLEKLMIWRGKWSFPAES
jgi:hypothetical protein